MRRVAFGALLAMLVLPMLPPVAGQAAANCTASEFAAVADAAWCDNFGGSQSTAWTPSGGTTNNPAMRWTLEGGRWYGGVVLQDGTHGYVSDSPDGYATGSSAQNTIIYLTSPLIDLGSSLLSGVSFQYTGGSEAGWDYLFLQMQPSGSTAWTTVGELISGDASTPRTQATSLDSATSRLRLRFVFDPDSACDTFVQDDPALCVATGPGFWVDNVVVQARNPPAPPAPSPGARPELATPSLTTRTLDLSAFDSQITAAVRAKSPQSEVFVVHAEAYFQKGFTLVKVPMRLASGDHSNGTWSGVLPASHDQLSTGTWAVTLAAYDSRGALNTTSFGTISVTAGTPGPAPKISLLGRDATKEHILSTSDFLRFQVNSTLLRGVSYQLRPADGGRGPSVPLAYPYVLGAGALAEGPQTINVSAVDKLGRYANITVRATLDTLAPEILLTAPGTAYAGVPFRVTALVRERSQYAGVLTAGGNLTTLQATGQQLHEVMVTPQAPGAMAVSVSVQDIAGHHASASAVVEVRNLTADGAVIGVRSLANDLTPGSIAKVEVTVRQVGGLAPVPFRVLLSGGVGQLDRNVTLGSNGTAVLVFDLAGLKPGNHTLSARIIAPAAVVETDPGNDLAKGTVEIFLGRFTVEGQTYRIRASPNGLPSAAVDGAGKAYPLELDQATGETLYRFDAAGQNLTWDPLNPLDAPEPEEVVQERESPAPVAVLVGMLMLALAGWRRRR